MSAAQSVDVDGGASAEADLEEAHSLRDVRGTAVGQVVTVDTRQHDVIESPPAQTQSSRLSSVSPHNSTSLHWTRCAYGLVNGLRHLLRLITVQRCGRFARLDSAEAATARARVAHQHDRRGGYSSREGEQHASASHSNASSSDSEILAVC